MELIFGIIDLVFIVHFYYAKEGRLSICDHGSVSCKNKVLGTFLVVQWLRLHDPKAGGLSLISDHRTRPHAETKMNK